MAYNLLNPVQIFNGADMTGDLTSVIVDIREQDNIGIQLHWVGDAVGDFSVQISSDHRQDAFGNVTNPGNWVALPLDPAIAAAGADDDAYIDLNQMSAQYMRVQYIATSDSGVLNGIAVAKAV